MPERTALGQFAASSVTVCTVEGCERPHSARGMCKRCYKRWARLGTTDLPKREWKPCAVEDCAEPAKCRGWCKAHYEKWRLYGDPLTVTTMGPPRGDRPSYDAMHARLYQDYGYAKDRLCVDCGRQARDWSYSNACSDELVGDEGLAYCPHVECYSARCRSCHERFDARG